MFKGRIVVAVLVALAVIGAGCSDGSDTATTVAVDPADDVVFGVGVFPASVPDDFPVPAGSAIGSTMLVVSSGFAEVVMRISAEPEVVAEFFNQGLTEEGFAVDSLEGNDVQWTIEFSRDGAKGTIDLTGPLEGVTQAVVRYNVP